MTFENLDIWGKDDFFFFFKIDEVWSNAPSLERDAWFLEILIFFFWKDDDDDLDGPMGSVGVSIGTTFFSTTYGSI